MQDSPMLLPLGHHLIPDGTVKVFPENDYSPYSWQLHCLGSQIHDVDEHTDLITLPVPANNKSIVRNQMYSTNERKILFYQTHQANNTSNTQSS